MRCHMPHFLLYIFSLHRGGLGIFYIVWKFFKNHLKLFEIPIKSHHTYNKKKKNLIRKENERKGAVCLIKNKKKK